MEGYVKAAGAVLVAVVLILALGKQSKDMAVVLSMAVCAMAALVMAEYLGPVLDFLRELGNLGELDGSVFGVLLKAVGIGILGEIGAMICTDAGNSSLGKILQMLSAAVILWLSIPLFDALVKLIREIIGNL